MQRVRAITAGLLGRLAMMDHETFRLQREPCANTLGRVGSSHFVG
jgi:hypothetical protein